MEVYSTEEQQVEAIKKFFSDYGSVLIIGTLLGFAGLYGWNYYNSKVLVEQEAASMKFNRMLEEKDTNKLVSELANEPFNNSGYEVLSGFVLAQRSVADKNYAAAALALTNVIKESKISSITAIAKLRLSRVQAEEKKYDEALATLESITEKSFKAARYEVKGDILARQGKKDLAISAYKEAVAEGGSMNSASLKIKMDSLK